MIIFSTVEWFKRYICSNRRKSSWGNLQHCTCVKILEMRMFLCGIISYTLTYTWQFQREKKWMFQLWKNVNPQLHWVFVRAISPIKLSWGHTLKQSLVMVWRVLSCFNRSSPDQLQQLYLVSPDYLQHCSLSPQTNYAVTDGSPSAAISGPPFRHDHRSLRRPRAKHKALPLCRPCFFYNLKLLLPEALL